MQFFTLIAATLSLAAGTQAWTKDGNGVWVANNNWYYIRNIHVHEACTTMNSNKDIHVGASCAYWVDGAGNKFHGKCKQTGASVNCQ